eukprot:m.670264 g.670264  ORF g.670264 m.670264 type:complete len:69 (+) comp58526_c0_seq29:1617-1823(+)
MPAPTPLFQTMRVGYCSITQRNSLTPALFNVCWMRILTASMPKKLCVSLDPVLQPWRWTYTVDGDSVS